MKITFLLAQCSTQYLKDSIAVITNVLKELDVEIELVELNKLSYFNGNKTKEMDKLVELIHASKGVIAVTNVPMLSMHGAMQTFFDCATVYSQEKFDKPIFAITYSEWLGEVEAAENILKNWGIIGGAEGYKISLNKGIDFSDVSARLERLAEDFYRLIKQDRPNIASTERQIYNHLKRGQGLSFYRNGATEKSREQKGEVLSTETEVQIKNFVDILKQDNKTQQPKEPGLKQVDLSTKEQTIQGIANLLKRQVKENELADDEFTSISSGIYKKPSPLHVGQSQVSVRRIQQIPHYFVAKHDKSLEIILKYTITNSNEQGFIVIKDGDCEYVENTEIPPTVEFMLNEEMLLEILSKKITYQKAFMLGKLKVKGNFSILPKLDQVFIGI